MSRLSMTPMLLLCSLCLGLCMPLTAQAATPSVQNGKMVVADQSKSQILPDGAAAVTPVKGKDWLFANVGEDAAAKYGISQGLYIFDKGGKLLHLLPARLQLEAPMAVHVSPDGEVMAVDTGTSSIREWVFFRTADFKPLTATRYLEVAENPALVWNGSKGVLYPTIATESERSCGYDPCGPVSVTYRVFGKGEADREIALLQGTPLCNYTLKSFDAATGQVTAEKLCLDSAAAWETYPAKVKPQIVTAKIPQ